MKKGPCCCKMIAPLVLIAFFGCAGIQQEQAEKPREPAPQLAEAAVTVPAQPVPDESEMIRSRAKEMLLGKWRRQEGDTIEFMEDGTVTLYSAVERIAYPGSYRILDKEQLEITMKKGGTLTWGYAVTKGDLTLTAPTGVGMKYKRYRGK
ncbi:MAG TPA: hypothetical protein VLA94_02420 [Syntrophales bacterium]|nr:hypothetical protein [Syntrophales bacterium]